MYRAAALLLLGGVVWGCSHLDFDMDSSEPAWGEAYLEDEGAGEYLRMERLAKALATWEKERGESPADYLLGTGDVLEVSIFALEVPDQLTVLTRTVSRHGFITLPWAGNVRASGLSASQLEERVKAAYAGTYLKQPQVTVHVAGYRSAPVVVTGAVDQPGLFFLTANRSTVLECLAMAGGLTITAGEHALIVHGGNSLPLTSSDGSSADESARRAAASLADPDRTTTPVDLKELIDEGNMLLNLTVRGGDVLIVPPRVNSYIYVLGYVRRPGAYRLDEASRLDALRAVALGGGLATIARPSNSFLIRQTSDRQTAIPVNLKKIARGELPPLLLEPGDTLIVGTTTFGRMTEFLAPSMGATVSASAAVSP